jgi:hypothetical protein
VLGCESSSLSDEWLRNALKAFRVIFRGDIETSKPELLLLGRPEQLTERQAQLWLEQRDRFGREKGRSPSTKRWAQMYSPTGTSAV